MPQMMPMNWMLLYLMFLTMFFMFNFMNFFIFIKNKNFNMMKKNINKMYNWKW